MQKPIHRSLTACLAATLFTSFVPIAPLHAADGTKDDKYPEGVSLADDPATAMKKFRITPGLKIDVFAAEPDIQDVVSFAFDDKGRAYVVETGRRRTSVYDIRKHRDWTENDLSFRTVQDRIDFLKEKLVPDNTALPKDIIKDRNNDGKFDWKDLEVESERIRLIEDTNGDGKVDKSSIYAEGFNTLVSGVAAGIAVKGEDVYFTCIPDLWLLKGVDKNGKAKERVPLLSGFGVHIAYGGHDMHGLKFGPDGKLYFTIADRGTHVETKEGKKIELPDTGAVFRCNPDGTDFEVVATGLRNPQELAFDQYGNLFTGDNNADGGDKARWTHIVEGADYGWRYGWQHLPKLGAWNSEKLWDLPPRNTAAYILPAAAHIGHGPAGISYYPGTGLPDKYKDTFFYADFPGGVRYFKMRPFGASYLVNNPKDYLMDNTLDKMDGKLIWGMYPTDVDFAPGGGIYVLDWVSGWEKTGKGRIYRLHDPEVDSSDAVTDTKTILAAGMRGRSDDELINLLGHQDQRVRLAAQYAIAEEARDKEFKKTKVTRFLRPFSKPLDALIIAAKTSRNQMTRVHALWAIAQMGQTPGLDHVQELVPLILDKDPEVRAQTARVMGIARYEGAFNALMQLLQDSDARVRYFAVQAAGRYGDTRAIERILNVARENGERDPYLRHACMMALLAIDGGKGLDAAAKDNSPSVRIAALLGMRKLESPDVAQFLKERDNLIVLEAARAINDVPINDAMPQLAELTKDAKASDPILRRAMNANFRLGKSSNAQAISTLVAQNNVSEAVRVEGIEFLGDWAKPGGRDRITGLWRPIANRDAAPAKQALKSTWKGLLNATNDNVRIAAIIAIEKLEMKEAGETLRSLVADSQLKVDVRVAALRALAGLKDSKLNDSIQIARADKEQMLRREGSRLLTAMAGPNMMKTIATTLEQGSVGEQQAALETLSGIQSEEADALVVIWLGKLKDGSVPREIQLDVLSAAQGRKAQTVKDALKAYTSKQNKKDTLYGFREVLYGGEARRGKEIFYERAEAACFRCHKINGEGGDVGPDLGKIGSQKDREFILDSIVHPNSIISPGYENVVVTLKSGPTVMGILKQESETELLVVSPEDGPTKIKKTDIAKREKGLSSMLPELGTILSKQDLRDVIEYLANLK
ncbi:MAG TPA: PVC-type heme-binding CxxCH protein [Verrucomicrobiae bacterium]